MAMCIVRLITRSDTSLSVALIAAAIILFRQPLRYVLDMVQDIEGRYRRHDTLSILWDQLSTPEA